ncbi:hypothetical protein GALL_165200 [mine drainage metagenome]|uniref:Uncharacterized protein n=1 Tax=mine drainage metagenome TaxID=410659 RepID=A0A1J5SMZ3_9ZZZZ
MTQTIYVSQVGCARFCAYAVVVLQMVRYRVGKRKSCLPALHVYRIQ